MPARPLSTVLTEINAYVPNPADRDTWLRFDSLLAEVFQRDEDLKPAIETLLGIFERFPRHDGYGVLAGVMHGLERIGGYKQALVASVQRCPTDLGVLMLQRLHHGGTKTVGEVDVAALIAWGSERAPEINWTL